MIFKVIYVAIFLVIWFWIFKNYKLLVKEQPSEEEAAYLIKKIKLGIFLFIVQFIVAIFSMVFS